MHLKSNFAGCMVFGILDLIWSGLKAAMATYALVNSTYPSFVISFLYIDAVVSATFAGLLVKGAMNRRHPFLFSYIFWQVSSSVKDNHNGMSTKQTYVSVWAKANLKSVSTTQF